MRSVWAIARSRRIFWPNYEPSRGSYPATQTRSSRAEQRHLIIFHFILFYCLCRCLISEGFFGNARCTRRINDDFALNCTGLHSIITIIIKGRSTGRGRGPGKGKSPIGNGNGMSKDEEQVSVVPGAWSMSMSPCLDYARVPCPPCNVLIISTRPTSIWDHCYWCYGYWRAESPGSSGAWNWYWYWHWHWLLDLGRRCRVLEMF